MTFELHPNLLHKAFIKDLPLCRVLMEDEKHYPWFFLIPRRPNISRIIDLSIEEQRQMYLELDFLQRIVWEQFQPIQLNVAAIGNKTPQLHIHVIARFADDPAWPNTIWEHPIRSPYDPNDKSELIKKMKVKLSERLM